MPKKVVCTRATNLPEGAELIKDKEYFVVEEFKNQHEQNVYILANMTNGGLTKTGLRWYGYDASRFSDVISDEVAIEEEAEAMA